MCNDYARLLSPNTKRFGRDFVPREQRLHSARRWCARLVWWTLVSYSVVRSSEANTTEEYRQDEVQTQLQRQRQLLLLKVQQQQQQQRQESNQDSVEDSLFDPIQADPDCVSGYTSCDTPPDSTIEEIKVTKNCIDATCSYGGADPDHNEDSTCQSSRSCSSRDDGTDNGDCGRGGDGESSGSETCTGPTQRLVDKHWGSDPTILRMRDQLRRTGSGCATTGTISGTAATARTSAGNQHQHTVTDDGTSRTNRRPPIFLMPGLASTRLVAWRFKACPHHPLLSDIKVQDYVWLNINLMMQMSTIDVSCMSECLRLGRNQTDSDDMDTGCKLRPDEGLDAISSLSLYGIGSQILMGGTNTVYKWLIQWLADNLGYDVTNIVGLPYDWRLSPDKMEQRDGFLTLTRRRIEAAVQTNGAPGIMVAHSMGNSIFRYFLTWIRNELREEAYHQFVSKAKRRAKANQHNQGGTPVGVSSSGSTGSSSAAGVIDTLPNAANVTAPLMNLSARWVQHSTDSTVPIEDIMTSQLRGEKHETLWTLAQLEGDANWYEWIETHIWTYVGLSAPLLGAVNPLRAVLSGENMGLPVTDPDARIMELTFGSTHTVNPISSKNGFCDQWDIQDQWDEEPSTVEFQRHADSKLACLDDILYEIEASAGRSHAYNATVWEKFPALKRLLRDRVDWDTKLPMIRIIKETCQDKEKRPCASNSTNDLGPKDVETGFLFTKFNAIWKEENEPMIIKRDQLRESFWDTDVTNILNRTWERPLIKHIIMAYGVDVPTEMAYEYIKTQKDSAEPAKVDGMPTVLTAYWETAGGAIAKEQMDHSKAKLTDFWKKKQKRVPTGGTNLHHSGDGSVPYLSLAWAHTWLLHSVRARRFSGQEGGNPLDDIEVRHRPEGAMEWVDGPPPKRLTVVGEKKVEESSDTGTAHPHGTKYKPEMVRYHNNGKSRTTGIEYTTTVIEALAVEHKETTRNYDILAAVFTDVLKYMHDDITTL